MSTPLPLDLLGGWITEGGGSYSLAAHKICRGDDIWSAVLPDSYRTATVQDRGIAHSCPTSKSP